MTANRNWKRRVRARAAKTGESYSAALRHLREQEALRMHTYEMKPAGVTDIGHVREHNEDSLLADGDLVAVADGMGGHGRGGEASRIAVDALRAAFADDPTADGLIAAVRAANQAVRDQAVGDRAVRDQAATGSAPDERPMGTTIAAVAMVRDGSRQQLVIANVGDSRIYLLRAGELSKLSADHSVVGELVAAGALSEEEAVAHPRRHVLTQALGPAADIVPHLAAIDPVAGDRLLLCSDGLTNEVDKATIAAVLEAEPDVEAASATLVAKANDNGGSDNVTAVVVDVG